MSQVPSVVIGLIGLVWLTSREPSSAISPVMAAAAAPLLLALIIYPRFTSFLLNISVKSLHLKALLRPRCQSLADYCLYSLSRG